MKTKEIASLVNGQLIGDGEVEITGVAPLDAAGPSEISFLANSRYQKFLETTRAGALLLPKGDWNVPQPVIICENSYLAFARVLQAFHPVAPKQSPGVHSSAIISEDVYMGENVSIGAFVVVEKGAVIGDNSTIFPHCYVGADAKIGNDVIIYPNVTIRERVTIGDRVIIHSGAVLGSDGFGFAEDRGVYHKIPQVGSVVIEDDVEIGANCCIDRATLGETRIRSGSKLDNLIQIAHNVEVGNHTVMAAQAGISGSTKIGSHCMIGGQVGMVGHITVGDFVICGAQAGVTKSIPDKTFVSGYPARPHRQQLRLEAMQMKLPDLVKTVQQLEKKLAQLEQHLGK